MSTAPLKPVTHSTSTIRDQVDQLLTHVKEGRIIEAMEKYYAPDVVMQENNNPSTSGLAANIEREKQFVGYVKQWKSFDVDSIAIDESTGKALIQSRAAFDAVDGKSIRSDQVSVQTWTNGKISHEKFYYDSTAK